MLTISRAPRRRTAPAAVTALATASLLAACASASTAPAAGKATRGSQAQAPAVSGAGHRSTSAGTSGLAGCQPAALQVTVNASQADGAAGSTYYPVDFTNTSSSPCEMYGYPGLSLVSAGTSAGHQIGAAAQQNPSFGKLAVRLAAGGVAHAWLQVAQADNYSPTTCQPVTAHWLRVFAPGQAVPVYVSHAFPACSSSSTPLLTVMPVRAGRGVRGTTP